MRATMILILLMAMGLVLLQACVIRVNADGHDISKVFGGIEVDDGRTVGDLESVNGSIELGDNSAAGDVETVNGSIKLRDDVMVESLETVNGSIRAGDNLKVDDDVETVNGSIELRRGSVVGDNVSTVNGDIELEQTEVRGNVETVNGDIDLLYGTVVMGDVVFEEDESHGWWGGSNTPTLTIDEDSKVRGSVVLYQEVHLRIDTDAEIGGDIIERY